MPDAKHPIWIIIRQLILVGVLGLMLLLNYNGWDSRDINTILVSFGAGLGLEFIKKS